MVCVHPCLCERGFKGGFLFEILNPKQLEPLLKMNTKDSVDDVQLYIHISAFRHAEYTLVRLTITAFEAFIGCMVTIVSKILVIVISCAINL